MAEKGPVGCASLVSILRLAEDTEASLLIIAGDMFDSPRISDELVRSALSVLRTSPLPVVILPGNHDCLVPGSVYLRHRMSDLVPNVKVIMDAEGESVRFPDLNLCLWGRPHMDYSDFSPLAGIPERGEERWQVAIAHGLFAGEGAAANRGWKITDREIEGCLRDYVALGHLETFSRVGQNGVAAYYSGSPGWTGAVAMIEFSDEEGPSVSQTSLPLLWPSETSTTWF